MKGYGRRSEPGSCRRTEHERAKRLFLDRMWCQLQAPPRLFRRSQNMNSTKFISKILHKTARLGVEDRGDESRGGGWVVRRRGPLALCVSPERLALLKRLEAAFPPMEDPATGTKVSIGVAS